MITRKIFSVIPIIFLIITIYLHKIFYPNLTHTLIDFLDSDNWGFLNKGLKITLISFIPDSLKIHIE